MEEGAAVLGVRDVWVGGVLEQVLQDGGCGVPLQPLGEGVVQCCVAVVGIWRFGVRAF